jgi:hypothetical protein
MGLLSAFLSQQDIKAIDFGYKHGTPVDCPRNELFSAALKSDVDILVWLDSDCFIRTEDIPTAADLIIETHYHNWAFTTVATPQRDGIVNVWKGDDAPYYQNKFTRREIMEKSGSSFASKARFPIVASGLGFAVFSLAKFRDRWPMGAWFQSRHGTTIEGASYFQSEDFTFTSRMPIEMQGEQPHCDPRFIVEHVHRGHHGGD